MMSTTQRRGAPDDIPYHGAGPTVDTGQPVKDSVESLTPVTPKARKPTKGSAAQVDVLTTLPAAMTGRASPAKAADGDKPVFAYIASLPQPQRSHRRTRRCPGGQDAAGPAALREVGHGVVWRRRRLVLLVRRLRRPRQAHLRARHLTHARTAGCADRDGQGLARRRPRIPGRHRRRPTRVVDETGHGPPRFRGAEQQRPG